MWFITDQGAEQSSKLTEFKILQNEINHIYGLQTSFENGERSPLLRAKEARPINGWNGFVEQEDNEELEVMLDED